MKNLWSSEPVLLLGVIQTGIAMLVLFGLHLTEGQTAAIIAFSTAVVTLIARSQVHSPSTVEAIKAAINENKPKE